MKPRTHAILCACLCTFILNVNTQDYDIQDFDPSLEGPWSSVAATVTGVAKVPNGFVTHDGEISAAEDDHILGV